MHKVVFHDVQDSQLNDRIEYLCRFQVSYSVNIAIKASPSASLPFEGSAYRDAMIIELQAIKLKCIRYL